MDFNRFINIMIVTFIVYDGLGVIIYLINGDMPNMIKNIVFLSVWCLLVEVKKSRGLWF
jgi:hypothetical protein